MRSRSGDACSLSLKKACRRVSGSGKPEHRETHLSPDSPDGPALLETRDDCTAVGRLRWDAASLSTAHRGGAEDLRAEDLKEETRLGAPET